VNRLLYRAKQRGFLEMDLLVGIWAQKNVSKMDAAQLKAMEEVLDQENPDLFKWLTGQESASEAMQANAAFKVELCTTLCRMHVAPFASQEMCRIRFAPGLHKECTQTPSAGL
jgi:succinate dehydrogenase flavin-adding protein (antitoxin of CptAB toxin-antitoxin module)